MDRLNLAAGERYDAVHNTILLDGVEALARKNNLAVLRDGYGLIRLPSSITYDAGTQKFTIPSGTVMIDAAGNIAELSSSLQTGSVPPAMIGSTLFLWAAIQPGKTPSNALVRVKNTGSGAVSFSTNTVKVDSVIVQATIASPADLTNPTAVHFPIATVTWVGVVPTATPISPLALGNSGVPGSVLGVLQDLATALDGIMGDDWFATPADDLASLDARATTLEVDRVSLPLSSHFHITGGSSTSSMNASGISLASIGTGGNIGVVYIDFSPRYKSTLTVGTAVVTYGAGVTANFQLFRVDATTGVETAISDLAAASVGGGESRAVLDVSGSHLADLSDGAYRAKFTFSHAGGTGTATIHFASVAGTVAP